MTPQLRIGIQGIRASFHDVAAREYFAGHSLELVECPSFPHLCRALKSEQTDYNLMAIENSIAGSILPNYLLLEQFQLRVIGEVYLRIEMNLMALPGQKIQDIHKVQSHPMALLQCQEFLATHPHFVAVEGSDTAGSAKDIRDKHQVGVAAIAGRLAAEVYGLEILARNIESDKKNYTRFLVVSRGQVFRENQQADKSSLRFEITHQPGSLLSVLSSFSNFGLNLTKLQSVPILGRPYQYAFHVDLEWDNQQQYDLALADIKTKTSGLIEFGEYKKDPRPLR